MSISKDNIIGVFFGGRSPEHDVSIITADVIISGLQDAGYTAVPVYIDTEGRWYIDESLGDISFFKNENVESKLAQIREYTLDLQHSTNQIVFHSKKGFLGSDEITIDIAFPAFHGPNGEDGAIQGLFEMVDIPYVGTGLAASSNAMDKVITKLLYQRFQIPTTDFMYLMQSEWQAHRSEVRDEAADIGFPLFVKPARAGSSIGISKATDKDSLEQSIDTALHYDRKVLVEEGITDVADLTVALLGNENPEVSAIQESSFEDDFFSYEDKYLNDGGAQLGEAEKNITIPADLDETVTETIKDMAVDIFHLFECTGTARVDFLYDRAADTIYANEINTMPGTLYHHLWKESGIHLPELIHRLLSLAKEQYQSKQQITTTFDTDILAYANDSASQKLQSEEQ